MAFDFSQYFGLVFRYFISQAGLRRRLCLKPVIRFLLSLKLLYFGGYPCLLVLQFLFFLRLQFLLFLLFLFLLLFFLRFQFFFF